MRDELSQTLEARLCIRHTETSIVNILYNELFIGSCRKDNAVEFACIKSRLGCNVKAFSHNKEKIKGSLGAPLAKLERNLILDC